MTAAPTVDAPAAGGGVWFSQATPGTPLGRVTPDGTIVEQPIPGLAALLSSPPRALAASTDGGVWIADGRDILRLTPGGDVIDYGASLPDGARPQGLAIGPDGSLWFTDDHRGGAIGRLSATGVVSEYRTGLAAHAQLGAITPGPDGNMWFTDCSGGVGRVTPSGTITEFTVASGCPTAITAGPDGNLWFTETGTALGVGRITPAGAVTGFPTGMAPPSGEGIAAGPDGRLYFTEPRGLLGAILSGPAAVGSISITGQVTQDFISTSYPYEAAWDIAPGGRATCG